MSFSSNKRGRQLAPVAAVTPHRGPVSTPHRAAPAPAAAEPPKPSLDQYKLTSFDLNKILTYTPETESTLSGIITPKFQAFRTEFPPNHKIDVKKYDEVYVTSDTHADYRKLIQMLKLANLIAVPKKDMGMSVDPVPLNPYSDDIYSRQFLLETRWVMSRTLFVIAGDIIDGRRCTPDEENLCEVQDPRGSFEVLIMAFLYNLRIEALKVGSDILFTLGNHDFNSVILEDNNDFAKTYAHSSIFNFYNSVGSSDAERLAFRRRLLTPFYENSPYYFLSLENSTNNKKEVGIIHASLHATDESSMLEKIITQQTEIDNGTRKLEAFFTEAGINPAPLWERIYNNKANRCTLVNALGYNLIVVGHCVTASVEQSSTFRDLYARRSILSQEDLAEAKSCQAVDGKGCVLTDCYSDAIKSPKLVFVDISSSEAFRSKRDINRKRVVELLKLSKLDQEIYYYVSKIKLDPVASAMKSPVLLPMRKAATPVFGKGKRGGYLRKTRHLSLYPRKKTRKYKR